MNKSKKLRLSTTTIRSLAPDELRQAAGGFRGSNPQTDCGACPSEATCHGTCPTDPTYCITYCGTASVFCGTTSIIFG